MVFHCSYMFRHFCASSSQFIYWMLFSANTKVVICRFLVAARSMALVCGRLPAEIVGSNPTGGMDVCLFECCVLSGRGLYDELITHLEESYRLWCVVMCDLESSWMRRPWPTGDCCAKRKKERKKGCNLLYTVRFEIGVWNLYDPWFVY